VRINGGNKEGKGLFPHSSFFLLLLSSWTFGCWIAARFLKNVIGCYVSKTSVWLLCMVLLCNSIGNSSAMRTFFCNLSSCL